MKKRGNNLGPDWAVSETVGFIIIFGIMMSGITLVTLYGYPALLDAQENANIRNMERNMISLQSDVNALTYKAVPYKETTMQVSGGVLSVDSIISNFMIRDGDDNPLIAYPDSPGTGALNFTSEHGEISIALQNGAVVKWQSDGSVMLSEPRWFIDTTGGTTTMVITLIQVDSSAYQAKSGISTVKMSIEPLIINTADITNIIDEAPSGNTVKIALTLGDKYHRAWKNYFENTLKMTQVPPNPIWQRTDINRVIIKAWKITIINL